MTSETFIAYVIDAGRVTIPQQIRELLGLMDGCKVRVTVEKVKEAQQK